MTRSRIVERVSLIALAITFYVAFRSFSSCRFSAQKGPAGAQVAMQGFLLAPPHRAEACSPAVS